MKTREDSQAILSQSIINNNMFLIANIAPRVGKIKITLNCLTEQDKVIVAYPEINIKNSWINDCKKWGFNDSNFKYTTNKSFKKLNSPCDVLILDEIHTLSEAQIIHVKDYINKFNITKVIGLTGTLSEETRINLEIKLGLKVKVYYPIEQAIHDKVITDYRIQVIYTPLDRVKDIKVKWSGGEFLTSEKQSFDRLTKKIEEEGSPKRLKMLRLQRMSIIKSSKAKIELTKKLLSDNKDKRILVFTGLTKVADSLGISSYHSNNNDENVKNDFLSGKLDKLAIVNKLNTGITFSKLNLAIINFFDSNSENMAQRISRVTCLEYDNPDKIARIIIVCSNEDVEKRWLNKALAFFDKNKISYLN